MIALTKEARLRHLVWLPVLILAGAFWDAHRSDVAFVDVFFGAGGGLLLGVFLMLRAWAAELERRGEWAEADQDGAFKEGIADERERVARVVDEWRPFAGSFSNSDLAGFIRRGDDL
jgi:hypothetical protein